MISLHYMQECTRTNFVIECFNIWRTMEPDVMRVYVSIKQAGRKRDFLSSLPFEVSDPAITLTELIKLIVIQNVKDYNTKEPDSDFVKLLTQESIDAQAATGKIGFGRRFSRKDASLDKAVEGALSAFSDGLYRVFIDEREILTLDDELLLHEDSQIAFIRLTFLSGRMW